MKFLCDSCKAKYQIADEKVAGKTVRMKCRKCGHQIEVRAAVTETSVSTSPPPTNAANPSGFISDAPRPMTKSNLATSLSAAKPRAPVAPTAAVAGGLAGAFQRTVQEAPQNVAFPPQDSSRELSVTDEWYVAINGVPVGPVRISELRRKAAAGAVTEESLCWQEGLEEWRPVRSIPELATIVREAALGNRPSLIAPAPNEGRGSTPPRAPQRPPPPRAGTPEPSPATAPPRDVTRLLAPSPSRSNVVPLRATGNATVRPEDDRSMSVGPGGAAPAFAPSFGAEAVPAFGAQADFGLPNPSFVAPAAMPDPFGLPPAADGGMGSASPSVLPLAPSLGSQIPPAQVPAQGKAGAVPLWFWPILLFTLGFGAMAAYFVFFRQPAPAPVVIQLPASSAPPATDSKNDLPPAPGGVGGDVPAPPPPGSAKAASASASKGTGGGGGGSSNPAPIERKGLDLGGLVPSTGGPNVGGAGAAGPGPGGGLDSSSVERVVAMHRAGVKRTCWERGGADQKSSVNVTVSAQVGPGGNVVSTSSSGDDPVVAKCIETQVRGWMFSAPGSTTTVNIPFKFVRQ